MKRFILILFVLLLPPLELMSQSKTLTIVYICQEYSIDNTQLISELKNLIRDSDPFVVYLVTKTEPIVMNSDTYDEKTILSEISSMNSYPNPLPHEELMRLAGIIEREARLEGENDEEGYFNIVSKKGISTVDMHFFVGDGFVSSGFHNSIVARLLLAENLAGTAGLNSQTTFHPCGSSYGQESLHFDDKLGLTYKIMLEK